MCLADLWGRGSGAATDHPRPEGLVDAHIVDSEEFRQSRAVPSHGGGRCTTGPIRQMATFVLANFLFHFGINP